MTRPHRLHAKKLLLDCQKCRCPPFPVLPSLTPASNSPSGRFRTPAQLIPALKALQRNVQIQSGLTSQGSPPVARLAGFWHETGPPRPHRPILSGMPLLLRRYLPEVEGEMDAYKDDRPLEITNRPPVESVMVSVPFCLQSQSPTKK